MKVLLTGANGFVGSHVLDVLRGSGLPVAALLRPTGNTEFIRAHLSSLEIRSGSITDRPSLDRALHDVTHVIHCAGSTKALGTAGFFEVNQMGTRQVVEAVNARADQIERLVHISSLAAAGPSLLERPVCEDDPPRPVSAYGESKLAGEREVTSGCRVPFTVLRPPAVYGPRDREFLRLFKAVGSHLLPLFGGGKQALSLVFVKDLAEAVVKALTHPGAAGSTFFVASPEIVTSRDLAEAIAGQTGSWTLPLRLPTAVLYPVCAVAELRSRVTRRANVLSLQKYAELSAPAWTCDSGRLRQVLGFQCETSLAQGAALTQAWYAKEGWL